MVALKLIAIRTGDLEHSEVLLRFDREVRLTAQLQHSWEAIELASADNYSPTIMEAERPPEEGATVLVEPPPTSAATALFVGTGTVEVETLLEGVPGSAFVELNGTRQFTPVTLTVPSGTHSIRASRPGYLAIDRKLVVTSASAQKLVFDLQYRKS